MRAVKVNYYGGKSYVTSINGTDAEIRAYFQKGKYFNVGNVNDDMRRIRSIKIFK